MMQIFRAHPDFAITGETADLVFGPWYSVELAEGITRWTMKDGERLSMDGYAIPAGANPKLVNVQITVAGGMPAQIGKVANAAACGTAGGWYYDNETTPTMIILCPQSCDAVKGTPNSGVEVLYGCPSNPPA